MLMNLLVSMTDPHCIRLEAADVDEIEVFMTDPVYNRLEALHTFRNRSVHVWTQFATDWRLWMLMRFLFLVRNPPHFLSSGFDFNKKNHEKHS
jgi:hypothetical protein